MQQHNLSTLKSRISLVLRRFYYKPLDLYAYSDGHMDLLRRSKVFSKDINYNSSISSLHAHIFSNRFVRTSAVVAVFMLVLLTSAILVPLYNKLEITEAATGTAKESSLSFNLTNSTASVDLTVNDTNGTFASSSDDNSKVRFNISTTNYTGYTLSIKGNNDNRQLVNSTNSNIKLNSISSTINYDSFNSNSDYNNLWGYLPSKLNSSTNTSYLPAPTTTASTLDTTSSANSSVNTYTIGIGARASYTTPAGEYTGTYVLTAISNTIAYYISFSDNSGDSTVAYMPGSLYGSVSTTSVTLPSTIPTRTGYTFRSWCLGTVSNSGTTCSSTEYNANSSFGLDQTSFNGNNGSPMVLYATWTINTYPCYLYYRLQNADSSYPNDYTYGGVINSAAPYSSTCSHTTGLDSTQYVNQTGSEVVYGITNVYISVPRTSYYLTVSHNTSYIGSSTGSGWYLWGATASISATASANNKFTSWSQTAGTTSSFGNTASASTTFVMPVSNATVYAEGEANAPGLCTDAITCMQTYDEATCIANATAAKRQRLTDARDGITYLVSYINGSCWMVNDLRTDGTIDGAYSNFDADSIKITARLTSGNSYTQARAQQQSKYQTAWYNYCAASAGTICNNSDGIDATQDICPSNWRLPTFAEARTIGVGSSTYRSTFAPSSLGMYYSGGITDPDAEEGYYWTSTNVPSNYHYYHYILGYHDGYLDTSTMMRDAGLHVRCILNS